MILLVVHGYPAPQGSKTAYAITDKTGRARAVQKEASAAVGPWREAVKTVALQHRPAVPLDGALELATTFLFRRPANHYGTGRNTHALKPSAPPFFRNSAPDQSKLIRSTEDAITDAGLWRDDARVVSHLAVKGWSDDGFQGALITIAQAGERPQVMIGWARAVAADNPGGGWLKGVG
jgi:Holliday junction resolvase RusA-like endonuclease